MTAAIRLSQINRDTVKRLTAAWTYHSGDGMGNIQCNPIVVDGVMYGPTPGRAIVALDAMTGREQWRFQVEKPERVGLEDAPARRGLVYWPGNSRHGARVVSHDYPLLPWVPEKVLTFDFEEKVMISGTTRTVLYLYRVPAAFTQ